MNQSFEARENFPQHSPSFEPCEGFPDFVNIYPQVCVASENG